MALEYYFRFPFAVGGDKTPLADTIQPDGTVSWQQGYSVDYQLDPATNPLAKNIDRLTYNGSLYPITRAIQEYQQAGNPDWITPAQNGGTPFSYALNAIVRFDDGGGVKLYRNTIDGNTAAPDVSGWVDATGSALSDATPLVNGTAAPGVSTSASRGDHVHPTDATRAPLASPALTGTPTSPTATPGTNTTQIATTAFVNLSIPAAFQGSNQSLIMPGYQVFPGGLIQQWGSVTLNVTSVGTWTKTTATFPISFPTSCLGVVSSEATTAVGGATPANNQGIDTVGIDAITASSFRQWGFDDRQTGSTVFNYFAWGY